MARNGTEFGVRLSGTGDRWFTGPSGMIDGLYLPGYGAEDANPDIGDSTITETVGLGGFAMAAAPAIVRVVGGRPEDAHRRHRGDVRDHAGARARRYQIPALGFRGTPLGIDCREVVHTGVLPFVNTGIAHREPGIGQIGAGLVKPPMEAFVAAARGAGGMIAHRVAAPVLERAPARGVVAASCGTAAYLELDGFVVAVTARGVPLMPNGVALTDGPSRAEVRWGGDRVAGGGHRPCT